MSIRATKWAHGVLPLVDLPPTERMTLVCLAFYHTDKTGECFPAMQTLADDVGVTSRRIQQAVDKLVAWGLITKKRGGTAARNASNRYTLFGNPKRPKQTGTRFPVQTGTKKPVQTGTRFPVSNRNTVSDERGYLQGGEGKAVELRVLNGGRGHV